MSTILYILEEALSLEITFYTLPKSSLENKYASMQFEFYQNLFSKDILKFKLNIKD